MNMAEGGAPSVEFQREYISELLKLPKKKGDAWLVYIVCLPHIHGGFRRLLFAESFNITRSSWKWALTDFPAAG